MARKYTSAESLARSTTTSASDQTKLTLTWTPDANSRYAIIWSCHVDMSTTTDDVIVKLKNNAGTAVCTTNTEAGDTTDVIPLTGFHVETFGSSPTSQSYTLTYATETATTTTAGIRNARLIAIKLDANDVYAENTGTETSSSTTLVNAVTAQVNAPLGQNYVALGYCEYNVSSVNGGVTTQLSWNGTNSYSIALNVPNNTTNYVSTVFQANLPTGSGFTENVSVQFASGATHQVNCRNAKVLILYAQTDVDQYIDTSNTTTTSTTYTNKITPYSNGETGKYLIIGSATVSVTATTESGLWKYITDGDEWGTTYLEGTSSAATNYSLTRATGIYITPQTNAEKKTSFQYRTELSVSVSAAEVYLTYIKLEEATPPNKARKYHSAESLTESTTTSTANQTKATLTFTPDASSTYVYMWSCDVKMNNTTYDVRVSLLNGATTLGATNWESADTTADYATLSGIAFETFGVSPVSQSITLVYSSENTAGTAGIRNARIVAIKLNASDAYVENTADSTTTSASLQTATTLTFTPATAGNYLILGSCEYRSASTGVLVRSQITYSGTGYSIADARQNDTTNYISNMMQASVGYLTASSKSVTLQYYSGSAGTSVNCRRARLVALRLDELTDVSIKTDDTSSTTTSTTYVTKLSSSFAYKTNLSYLLIGTASIYNNSTTNSTGAIFKTSAATISESFQECTSAGYLASARISAFAVTSDPSIAYLEHDTENASATSTMDDATISALLLDPGDLYWVGGTGTWDSSNTTNWSVSSGGSGSAAAPKAGTNVYFDSASDSGAGFTVTVSTSAVCNDLTASGLDQTMTLSGTAALSVYGSFSVPATNFTQSYTGTITFASTSQETITTNGKSFTAFTFNGVNGSWTLQDAATITGAATLTNGTLALGSYTFTCDTFASNNSNSRTINFGTGKIVITSTSTATVWNTATITSLTISGTPLVELTGGGATTKTISAGALAEASSISFSLLNTAGTVAFTASNTVRNLIIANNSFTVSNIAITIYGDLTINGTSPTLTAGANTWTFAATSGTKVVTTNGKTIDFPLTFDGVGGTWRLGSALTVGTTTSRTVTLTNGTLDLYGYDFTLFGIFSSSNSNVRALKNTGGTTNGLIMTLDTATAIWQGTNTVNLTADSNFTVKFSNGGAATTKTINGGTGGGEAGSVNFEITSSFQGTFSTAAGTGVRDFTLANATYTVTTSSFTVYGSVSIGGASVTLSASASTWTFTATSGTKTITTNGKTLDFPITFSGVDAYWQLQDALSVGTSTARAVTHTSGSLDLNGYTVTIFGSFLSSNSNARTLAFGSTGKIVLTTTAATSTTICNITTETNLTVTGTNPLIQVTGSGVGPLNITGTSSFISLQLSPSAAANFAVTQSVKSFVIDNSANITLANSPRSIYGSLTISGTNPTLTAGTAVTTFAATSGTQTITTSGKTLDFPITFNGVGGTWALVDDLTIGTTTSRAVTLTNGTFDLNNKKITIYGTFVSSGTATRRIQNTGGNQSTSTNIIDLDLDTAATVWSFATATGFTTDGNVLVAVTGGGATTKTVTHGTLAGATESNVVNLVVAGGIAGTVSVNGYWKNLTFANSTYTITNTALTIYGDVYFFGTTQTLNSGSNAWTFAATSGTQNITSGGETFDFPLSFSGTATYKLLDNLTVASGRAVDLLQGTLDLNSQTFSMGTFTSSATTETRRLQTTGGSGGMTTTGTGAGVVFKITPITNLTTDGNIIVTVTGGGAARTVNCGALDETNSISFVFSVPSGSSVAPAASTTVKNLTYSGGGQLDATAFTIYGNYTTTSMTYNGSNDEITFAGSGTQVITTNGIVLNRGLRFDGTGTFRLGDALDVSNRDITFNLGTLNLNNFNFNNIRRFTVTGSGAKVLAHGTGDLIVTGTTTTSFNATGSNLTSTGTGKIDMTGGSAKTFVGGGNSYNTLNQGGSGALTITGSNTFKNITNTVQPATVSFTAGTTNTFTEGFSLAGQVGSLITIQSASPGSQATIVYTGSTKQTTNYSSYTDMIGFPAQTFYAGTNSTNGGNNRDIYFYAAEPYFNAGNGPPTWLQFMIGQ